MLGTPTHRLSSSERETTGGGTRHVIPGGLGAILRHTPQDAASLLSRRGTHFRQHI